jgi:Dyp-type peroxidase family
MAAPAVDLEDVQGLVYKGYRRHEYAGYLFAKLTPGEASRAWLRSVPVANAKPEKSFEPKIHVAFARRGLAAVGVPEAVLANLPQELSDGMAARAKTLGDTPETWTLRDDLDVLLMIYACEPHELATVMGQQRAALTAAGATVHADELACKFAEREHFGFADGLSQPFITGMHAEPRAHEHPIAVGEVLLGYENGYAKLPASPRWDDFDLGANGTYVVFRKLAQDVGALWQYLGTQAEALGLDRTRGATYLAAKLMGRWPSGAPVVMTPDRDDEDLAGANNFMFLADDPDGLRCPIASHIRRANPRDARDGSAETSLTVVNRHRILRRGRSWGPPTTIAAALAGRATNDPRGLYFIGLGASIARGFEFIQQSWLVNPGFHGLDGESDPITGPGSCPFTIPAQPYRLRLPPLPPIVTTLGGGYFFLPSLSAIARIVA